MTMPTNPAQREPGLTIEGFLARSAAGESTVRFYRDELARFERRIGAPLATAPVRALERLKGDLRRSKSGPTRCRLLRQFFRAAGQLDRADIFRLRRKDARIAPADILTLPEVNEMVRAARSVRDRAFIAVLWETGVRVSEVLSLNVGDVQESVSRENGGRAFVHLFFRHVKEKGQEHASLLIEGGDHLRAWLGAYQATSLEAPLFPSGRGNGVRLTRDGAEKLIVKTAARAKIGKRVFCHLFRHSRTTHLLQLGVPEAQVAKLHGWKSTRMLARYSHLVDRDAYAALLRAHGMEPPEMPTRESLVSAEGDLRPVVPMVAAPGHVQAITSREVADLLTDPNVQRFAQLLRGLLEAARPLPPE